MSLSVAYNQNFKTGIDTSALKEVTQQIFQRANAKTSNIEATFDLSKFSRPTVGMDLYSGKVDAATARQVSQANAGVGVNLSQNALNSIKYLTAEASKSIAKNVDGKIALPEAKEAVKEAKSMNIPSFGRLTETADLGSDKRGSNPFYKGELLAVKKEEKEKVEDTLNIFA